MGHGRSSSPHLLALSSCYNVERVRCLVHTHIHPRPPHIRSGYATQAKSSIISIGLTIHNTPVDLRERLAVPEAEWPRAIEELCSYPHIEEAGILSTCNRLELYVVAVSWHRGVREVRGGEEEIRLLLDALPCTEAQLLGRFTGVHSALDLTACIFYHVILHLCGVGAL